MGYDILSAINPASGFGQTGPNRRKPGFGTLAEAYPGFASITGYPDRPPLLPGFGLADSTTGVMGAFLAMVALFEQRKRPPAQRRDQVIDLAIYETLFTLLGPKSRTTINSESSASARVAAFHSRRLTSPRSTRDVLAAAHDVAGLLGIEARSHITHSGTRADVMERSSDRIECMPRGVRINAGT